MTSYDVIFKLIEMLLAEKEENKKLKKYKEQAKTKSAQST